MVDSPDGTTPVAKARSGSAGAAQKGKPAQESGEAGAAARPDGPGDAKTSAGNGRAGAPVPRRDWWREPPNAVALGLAAFFLILLAGCLAWPGLFWDRFLFPYIWGSTEADAVGHPVNGVNEDYNLVSTAVYGIILAAAVYLIYSAFKKRGIAIDPGYILALVPFVLYGTLVRALEDSFYFSLPAAYLFISPQIYALVGALVVGLTFLGGKLGPGAAWPLLWLLVPFHLLFLMGGFTGPPLSAPPLLAAVTLVLITGLLSAALFRRNKKAEPGGLPAFLMPFGLQAMSAPLFLVTYWCVFPGAWGPEAAGDVVLHAPELLVVPGLAVVSTLLVWLALTYFGRWRRSLAPMAGSSAILVFFGHLMDASATYRAIDFYHYGEKHVLATTLINATGTALVMFPMKLVAIGTVLYVLLVELKADLDKEPLLRGLLLAALMVLGLSPGLRDLLRLVMGV